MPLTYPRQDLLSIRESIPSDANGKSCDITGQLTTYEPYLAIHIFFSSRSSKTPQITSSLNNIFSETFPCQVAQTSNVLYSIMQELEYHKASTSLFYFFITGAKYKHLLRSLTVGNMTAKAEKLRRRRAESRRGGHVMSRVSCAAWRAATLAIAGQSRLI